MDDEQTTGNLHALLIEAGDEIGQLRNALLDAITVFDIGEDGSTQFHKAYADVIARARREPGAR